MNALIFGIEIFGDANLLIEPTQAAGDGGGKIGGQANHRFAVFAEKNIGTRGGSFHEAREVGFGGLHIDHLHRNILV